MKKILFTVVRYFAWNTYVKVLNYWRLKLYSYLQTYSQCQQYEVMGKMRACGDAVFCGLQVWQKVKWANPKTISNPNTNPIPNTNPNLIPNPINPKLQARIPAGPHFTICHSMTHPWTHPLTCIESVLMISPQNSDAISTANFDLPVAVAPTMTIIGCNLFAIIEHLRIK